MAERRMFSKRIVNSARFIQMPPSTQALYFHLGLNADDDGVVEAFNIMRLIGATEDELKILSSKGLVTVLNNDLVTYVNDWRENNSIRPDRKVNSIYKDLLVKIIPEIELVEPKKRADTKKTTGQPMDVQRTTNGRLRLGKDSIGKDSIGKDKTSTLEDEFETLSQESHNEVVGGYRKLVKIFEENSFGLVSPIVAEKINAELKDFVQAGSSIDEATNVIKKAMEIATLNGANNISYVFAITKKWYQHNLFTLSDVEAFENQQATNKQNYYKRSQKIIEPILPSMKKENGGAW